MTKENDHVVFKSYLDSLSKKERNQEGKLTLTEQEMDRIAGFFAGGQMGSPKERSVLGELWHGLTWWVKGDPW